MPRIAANISTMFTERPLIDRFDAARTAGFAAVEIQFPYGEPLDELVRAKESAGLDVVLINVPAGDWSAGERGLAALPGREREFSDGVTRCMDYAQWLGCRRVNALGGIPDDATPEEEIWATLSANLRHAAKTMEPNGIRVMTEPANSHDLPGFFVDTTEKGLEAIMRADHTNLWLQYDIYHMVRMGRNVDAEIETAITRIGHIQFADVPGRHEPGTGEIDFPTLFARIDATGYEGWCGAEYFPAERTEDGLGWLADLPGS